MKRKKNNLFRADVILTIAGFDATGGAGISTDIKICSFLNIQNISVIGSIVIQSPFEVYKKIDVEPKLVIDQIVILNKYYNIKIINIGLIGDFKILEFILQHFQNQKIVFDPIFFSGSGKFRFVTNTEIHKLKNYLEKFFLITPNIPEAEILSNMKINSFDDIKKSIQSLTNLGAQNILIKGGHLKGEKKFDTLFFKGKFYTFDSVLTGYHIHGTGGFLNAAISAFLFKGEDLLSSIKRAKRLLQRAIKGTSEKNPILNI